MVRPRIALLTALCSVSCGARPSSAPPAAAVVSPAPQPAGDAPPAATSPPEAAAPAPVAPEARCTIEGAVSQGGGTWSLRTRPDAMPTMTVENGTLKAWVPARPRTSGPWTVRVALENASTRIQAVILGEDVRVFLTKPFFVRKGWVPDGVTERRVVDATDASVSVEIGFEKLHSTTTEVPCADLGVMPSHIDAEALLSRAGGEVVLKATAPVHVGEEKYPASSFWTPSGVAQPAGTLAFERGPRLRGPMQLVSIETCGGTVLGEVSKGDLVGQPRLRQGSSARCPGTSTGVFVAEQPLVAPLRCPSDMPLFVRSSTFEDPVGTLKAGATLESQGGDEKGTTRVRIRNPAATPSTGAAFTVKSTDLATCKPTK